MTQAYATNPAADQAGTDMTANGGENRTNEKQADARQTRGFRSGWLSGMIGILIFSGSLPATRIGVLDFSPWFLTGMRAVIAAALAALLLLAARAPRPDRSDIGSLIIVAIGVVVGFPLLSGLALLHINVAHSVVFMGMLPLATAVFAVLRGGERPGAAFWLFSLLGAGTIAGFALHDSSPGNWLGDGLMIGAIVICGLGYAEGAALSRKLGGWQVISWALLLALPLMAAIALATQPPSYSAVSTPGWAALGYVAVFSMLVGFVFWYRGLALGGIAGVGQLQLLQPFIGLMLAAALLGEPVAGSMIAASAVVVLCVAGARRFA